MNLFKNKFQAVINTAACVLTGLAITLIAFHTKASDARADLENEFVSISEQIKFELQEHIDHCLYDASSLRSFFESSNYVSWDEFETFVDPIIKQNPSLAALIWIPRVPGNQRNDYESKMRSYGFEEFKFQTFTDNGTFQTESALDSYYPVYYFKRYLFFDHFMGLNLSGFNEKKAIFEATITDAQSHIAPVLRRNNQSLEPGTHCVYIPVYRSQMTTCTVESRLKNLMGFIGAYLDMDNFLAHVIESNFYDIRLAYPDNDTSNDIFRKNCPLKTNGLKISDDKDIFYYRASIPVANQCVCIDIFPGDNFLNRNKSRAHWIILVSGIIVSILAGLYINSLHLRQQKTNILVAERTSQYQIEKEKANQMAIQAQAASRAKNEFLANMSHEMRTPMNSIIGFSELLAEENLNEDHADFVNTILLNAKHLLDLINNILDLARIEAEKMESETAEFDLRTVIFETQKMLLPLAENKGLELRVNLDRTIPQTIIADKIHVRQCIINLVANAVKFTEAGHVLVRARFEETDTKPQLYIEIADTGVGIPPEKQQDVFTSFSQADNTAERKFQGTGLGLTITKKLIELMGGYITLESKLNVGTSFTMVLPVDCPSCPAESTA